LSKRRRKRKREKGSAFWIQNWRERRRKKKVAWVQSAVAKEIRMKKVLSF